MPSTPRQLSLGEDEYRHGRAGRADAKERGVKFGRKPPLIAHQQSEARKRLETGETQRCRPRLQRQSE